MVEEEADKSAYWLELIIDVELFSDNKVQDSINEAYGLTAIFVTTGKTFKLKK